MSNSNGLVKSRSSLASGWDFFEPGQDLFEVIPRIGYWRFSAFERSF